MSTSEVLVRNPERAGFAVGRTPTTARGVYTTPQGDIMVVRGRTADFYEMGERRVTLNFYVNEGRFLLGSYGVAFCRGGGLRFREEQWTRGPDRKQEETEKRLEETNKQVAKSEKRLESLHRQEAQAESRLESLNKQEAEAGERLEETKKKAAAAEQEAETRTKRRREEALGHAEAMVERARKRLRIEEANLEDDRTRV